MRGLEPASGLRPVFERQARNAAEVSNIPGDQNEPLVQGGSGNDQIVVPNQPTRLFQANP
jgi:hypothetical protein